MLTGEHLLILINGLGGIVWEADPDTFQFSFVSAEAERILGFPVSAWTGDPDFWRHHTHPDDLERCTKFCLEATRLGRDHEFEYRMIAADGRVVWLRDIVNIRTSPEGVRRLVGIALDITSEKEEQADKQRLARLYEALIENSSDNISMLRSDGVTVYQSPAVFHQLGFQPQELIGRNNFDMVHPDDVEMTGERFAAILGSGAKVGPIRFRFRHKDGDWRVLDSIGKRFTTEDGSTFVVVNTRDVTEMVHAQRQLETTQEQLAQAMRMEAVGRLAGGVAHDFNNLLTVIAGYAELVAASLQAPDPRADDLGEIKRAAHRASLLTRQLLTFSRKQVVRPMVLDLNTVVLEVSVLIRRLIGEDIRLVLELSPEPARVFADAAQLEQVLMNLAVNARDAMPLGGQVSIRTEADAGLVRLTVSDTGSGMPAEIAARCFEPFFTTKETGKGTGLGLATAYGIIKQAGGDIQVSSPPGSGCVFTVTLPMSRTGDERAVAASASLRGRGETILLVEDEDQVRTLVDDVLTRLGYTVIAAPDGEAALEICRSRAGSLSLLITDVVMPQMSGPQIFATIAAMAPRLPVLYISGYTGDAVLARGPRDEEAAFLQKPFTPAALAEKVREVLDGADGRGGAG